MKKNILVLLATLFLVGMASAGITDVTRIAPTDNSWNNSVTASIAFSYNFTSNSSGTANCTLYVSSTPVNSTLDGANATTITVYSNTTISEGNISWYVNCTDNENSTISDTGYFMVDRTAPTVTINSPSVGETLTSSSKTFKVTETDNLDVSTVCSISLSDGTSNSSISAQNNTPFYSTYTLADGGYTVDADCEDSAGNSGSASSVYFRVRASVSGVGTKICAYQVNGGIVKTDYNPVKRVCCPLDKPVYSKSTYSCVGTGGVTGVPAPTKPGFISVPGNFNMEEIQTSLSPGVIVLIISIILMLILWKTGTFND